MFHIFRLKKFLEISQTRPRQPETNRYCGFYSMKEADSEKNISQMLPFLPNLLYLCTKIKYHAISALKMNHRIVTLTCVMISLLTTGCRNTKEQMELDEGNAVYYWRTDLRLDSTERAFIRQHHINKVYCRYFDVVMRSDSVRLQGEKGATTEPAPNATIEFSDTLPDSLEIIPTIYITEDCMHQPHKGLAEKIVGRIVQMNETNGISPVREIQIDCDYTNRSRKTYYQFLEEVRTLWKEAVDHHPFATNGAQEKSEGDAILSTTIRLHQLSMAAPPADYGVLMIYNTGNPAKWEQRNPILDIRDVTPYLKYLNDYPLPLAAAYPVYLWVRNIKGLHVEHSVKADEILRVKQAVENARSDMSRAIITYHLDKENINRYNSKTYEEIYHH